MAESELRVFVNQDSPRSAADGVWQGVKGTKRAEVCVVDWLTEMALEGRIYQVQLGTITAPVTGDINVTDAAAEACADAQTGTTIMPIYLNVSVESINGGTLSEAHAKSVGAVSTAGDVFIPLPLYVGGVAANSTARMNDAGGVTVTAELATTTRVHFSSMITAQADFILADHVFVPMPVCAGPACFYLQVAGTTAGPTYFGHFDYVELPTISIS